MTFHFSEYGWDDYQYWRRKNRRIFYRIRLLIRAIRQTPFEGLGNPEPLMNNLQGYWSRRISGEHRLIYKVAGKKVFIAQMRYHY